MHHDDDETLEDARKKPGYRPGDYILDRYMPNATPEEREEAREALREVMKYLYGLPDLSPKPPRRDHRKSELESPNGVEDNHEAM